MNAINYNQERDRLWKSLERYGHKLNYRRPRDAAKYNLYLENGFIRIENKNGSNEILTIDSTLYFWLEGREY